MGCISSKKDLEDVYPNIFQVMNVDEHGTPVNPGQLEITDLDLVLYQKGKSPIKWPLRTLRRYGFDAEHFSFESGRRCQTGPGIYAFRCRRAEQLFNLLQSRIQTRNNGESDTLDTSNNSENTGTHRDSLCLEPASLIRYNPGSKFSSQNGMIRLSSVGSTSGSVGPLSPQSITSALSPLDTVPLIPPLPLDRPISQNLYANEDIIATVTQDLEETNNNVNSKTIEEPKSPGFEHSYLNSSVLERLQNENLSSPVSENHSVLPEEVSSPNFDNKPLYMNISRGTDKATPCSAAVQTQAPDILLTAGSEAPKEPMPNYANFDVSESVSRKTQNNDVPVSPTASQSITYLVLDLKSKSPPVTSPETPKKLTGGYAAIDFKKTVALSHSIKPNFETDSESSRKTRHSSNINNLLTHERHSSSVSE